MLTTYCLVYNDVPYLRVCYSQEGDVTTSGELAGYITSKSVLLVLEKCDAVEQLDEQSDVTSINNK